MDAYRIALVVGMLSTGTVNTLVKKYAYETEAEGSIVVGKPRSRGGGIAQVELP